MANPQNSGQARYKFIPRVLVFLTRGDEVLLIKRSASRSLFPNKYNGLGGHVERGESVLAAARREVVEECGLEPSGLWLCATVAIDTGDADNGIAMWVFHGTAEGEPTQSEEGEINWVPVSKIAELAMVEDIPTLLPKVLTLAPGDAPLWGRYIYTEAGTLTMEFDA
jgi:8-oxo-dGTP diphosphatase